MSVGCDALHSRFGITKSFLNEPGETFALPGEQNSLGAETEEVLRITMAAVPQNDAGPLGLEGAQDLAGIQLGLVIGDDYQIEMP